ncbi:T-complex protein 1 subunit zeta 1-like [Triticum urartu]|uniref:T-complex protein 1 subunit zeta 1-like n=1 Tax=Triticum dicoccoides TaxID=85692 RepID=UPI00188F1FC5|nr:T-complex protein 1 subunit zeta 1-like [Triticum dicoccoides]XP_037421102.1 T-complex protein 1 subunit zeta 1-like [Triticum dicoccoides]XP_044363689.1 T-complex protein 1 subunit zeta 1-like [Triticum aestivum]XP_044363690.1 T-complex protein 1 subunit zeta 1-like [Triticum aestivum]XP_048570934.1 T-complex protein 1 subunit zeta 1-like [Triticum urartu]XP_048570935.1 T-complex protein 1 subunit zeta 1-like [Triticum urartu]XP_048570936.1 T-complex protein 1 subunit zeta 1-like [Triticu
MVSAEGRQVDEHVKKIIELKYKVRSGSYNNFVVINQKSIGLPSIDLLDRVGVLQILFIDQEILICDMVNLSFLSHEPWTFRICARQLRS